MAPSATTSQSISTKIRRPVPHGIQTNTNGINSSTSSPSPSMSAGRLPSAAKYAPSSATSNGVGSNSSGARSANRNRREGPGQILGRGQRNSSVGLRSASIAGELLIPQVAEPQFYSM
jgi:transcription factor SPT20